MLAGVMGGDIAGTVGAATGMGGEALGEAIGGMFGAAGGPIGAAVGAAVGSAVGDVIKKVSDTIMTGMQLASPATFKQFTMAIEDVQATIGETFLPVLELVTEGFEFLGDIIATFIPDAQEMRASLGPLFDMFDDLRALIADVVGQIGPIVRNVLINAILLAATAFKMVYTALKPLITFLLGLFGIQLGAGGESGMRERTRAARPAAISSIEDYQRQLQTSAYSIGGRAARNYPQEQLDALISIHAKLYEGIPVWIIKQIVEKASQVVAGSMLGIAADPGQVGGAARSVGWAIKQAGSRGMLGSVGGRHGATAASPAGQFGATIAGMHL